jgi:ankyrin repeat protein
MDAATEDLYHGGILYDNLDVVNDAIQRGANVNAENQFGDPFITVVARLGKTPIVDALLKAGANPNSKSKIYNITTLMEACGMYGNVETVRLLLDAGADINAKRDGTTPISYALAFKKYDIAKELLRRGAVITDEELARIPNEAVRKDLMDARGYAKRSAMVGLRDYVLNKEGGRRRSNRRKTFRFPRKMGRKYCKKTPCRKMGFTQKASCRPYKNCYRKRV